MADFIEETENTFVLMLLLLLVLIVVWIVWNFRDFLGLGGGDDQGKKQSIDNASNGFPDGADPGSIPVFQVAQGIVESVRNFKGYVFGSNDGDEYTAEQKASMDELVDSYQIPDYDDVIVPAADQAPATISDWLKTLQTNPGALTLGNSPLF
jgi:hypothetical protein